MREQSEAQLLARAADLFGRAQGARWSAPRF